jgi:hypothetical protein
VPACSSTPLVKKLGIKDWCRLSLVGAPEVFLDRLRPMPDDVRIDLGAKEPIDVAVLFVTKAAALRREFPKLHKRLDRAGGLWVAYPKKASGVPTDVTFEVVQALGLAAGLVDNKVCAIDDVWTGLRFVYRKADR